MKKLLNVKACEVILEKDLTLSLLKSKLFVLSNNKHYFETIKSNLLLLNKNNNFDKIIKEICK